MASKAHGILIQIPRTAKEIPVMPHWWWILWSLWRISEHQMGQFEIMLMPSALMISRLFMQWLLLAVPHHWFIKLLILRYQAHPSPSLNEIQSDHISCYVPLHPWAGHSGQGEWYFFLGNTKPPISSIFSRNEELTSILIEHTDWTHKEVHHNISHLRITLVNWKGWQKWSQTNELDEIQGKLHPGNEDYC